ncbi:MAG: ABC transporter substrate-binding protein [Richelia sp. SM1_7_0]|nr:ABC transporter substrate-binding protein [Richelia sp. SM1_7_0]
MKLHYLPLKLRRQSLLFAICLLTILCACSTQIGKPTVKNSNKAINYTPVTIENCGMKFTYKQPPQRAITLNQPATEIMLALGLEKYMVGTAYVDNKIPSQYQEAYKKVPILSDKYPSREVLLANEPDFIYGSFPGAFGSDANRGREDFLSLRINSYLSPEVRELCKPKVGVLENLYGEIRDIGRIFRVEEQAKKFIASLQEQIQEIPEETRKNRDT